MAAPGPRPSAARLLASAALLLQLGPSHAVLRLRGPAGLGNEGCRALCQGHDVRALGAAFAGAQQPGACVARCNEVFPEETLLQTAPRAQPVPVAPKPAKSMSPKAAPPVKR
mmetsp:Transcript_30177/g.86594  ORF Transcript_30177/g.86594 Transcript_30177/m.86594 type:complete len:112 (-) Transcript_30177:19-354(-)